MALEEYLRNPTEETEKSEKMWIKRHTELVYDDQDVYFCGEYSLVQMLSKSYNLERKMLCFCFLFPKKKKTTKDLSFKKKNKL